jgi:hypothetical protein
MILVHLPGHGASPLPASTAGLGVDRMSPRAWFVVLQDAGQVPMSEVPAAVGTWFSTFWTADARAATAQSSRNLHLLRGGHH